jgi:hypothetical protein
MNSEQLNILVNLSKHFVTICVVFLSLLVIYVVAHSYWVEPPNKPEPRFKNTLQRDINP